MGTGIKKVLIIDDEMLMRTTLKILLSGYGIETILASNGNDGISLAKQEKPDIILLDLMLPDIDGWTVLNKLREDIETKDLPVVLFTAIDVNTNKDTLKDNNVTTIIRKPFQLKQLLSVLKIEEKEKENG